MASNPLLKLQDFGQSIWLDFIRRGLIASGQPRRLIADDGLRGVTSNPSIFEKAIAGSRDYDEAIRALVLEGKGLDEMYQALVVEDIQRAADLFRSLYDELEGRDGFVSRSDLLEKIRTAFQARSDLPNLLLDRQLSHELNERQADLRAAVRTAATFGLPVPGFMASLAYFDGYRSAWLPANLIQAQRDYFGAHTYERVDAQGVFHTHWNGE